MQHFSVHPQFENAGNLSAIVAPCQLVCRSANNFQVFFVVEHSHVTERFYPCILGHLNCSTPSVFTCFPACQQLLGMMPLLGLLVHELSCSPVMSEGAELRKGCHSTCVGCMACQDPEEGGGQDFESSFNVLQQGAQAEGDQSKWRTCFSEAS